MKKILLAASLAAVCSFGWAQTGEVPPDYPAQAAQYQTNPVDAQIEAVRRNYEDVKARAQMRLFPVLSGHPESFPCARFPLLWHM